MMVEIPPIITLYMSRVISTSGFMETIPPTTSPANESFAKIKKQPGKFFPSYLVLFLDFFLYFLLFTPTSHSN